jgi:hypothetical protein
MYLFKGTTVVSRPEDWPQKWFNKKRCKYCTREYEPQSPCNLYCSIECSSAGKTSAYLKRTYNITINHYEKLLREQNNLCRICGGEGFFMKSHHKLKLVVDHCHRTGIIRGLLCHNCNRGIGLLQDSPTILLAAKEYLEGATTISKESTLKRVEAPDTP